MITLEHNSKNVTWVSPPSETILRLVHEKEINLHNFGKSLGFTVEQLLDLLYDKIEFTEELACYFSKFLGGSKTFWLERYNQFKADENASNQLVISDNLNFLDSLSKARSTSIDGLLDDFKVSTFENLIIEYLSRPKILYSKTQKIEPSPVMIANWVRECEMVAEKMLLSSPVPVFSAEKLNDSLSQILSMTKVNNVQKVISKLKAILIKSGVLLVLSPNESGSGVSGFTKTVMKKYRLVVVTDRYKNNAAFWFTLLHELAHCILHSLLNPIIHYSDEEFILASLETENVKEETEANKFIEDLLFTDVMMQDLIKASKSYDNIIRMGVNYDFSTALLVAQIHRKKISPYSYFRKVFRKVEFSDIF